MSKVSNSDIHVDMMQTNIEQIEESTNIGGDQTSVDSSPTQKLGSLGHCQNDVVSAVATVVEDDPFDPDSLRLSQDFEQDLGVKKALLTVPVRKPDKTWWVRTHPSEEYTIDLGVIEIKEENEIYLVMPDIRPQLSNESTYIHKKLTLAVNRQNVVFLWCGTLPNSSGKANRWHESAFEAMELARREWIRVQADMRLAAYDVLKTAVSLPEPEWPDKSMAELLRAGFKDNVIDSMEHPVLRQLRGEA